MKKMSVWVRVCTLSLAAVLLLANGTFARAQQTPATYNINLASAQQSIDSQGRTVIVMQANGDLPGVLTLVLNAGADGSVSGGEWALTVSYSAPLNPNAPIDPTLSDPDSAQGEQWIQKGTVNGAFTGGSVTLTNGQVTAINALQLSVTSGTLQFSSVTSGHGAASGSSISDWNNSTGTLTLNF